MLANLRNFAGFLRFGLVCVLCSGIFLSGASSTVEAAGNPGLSGGRFGQTRITATVQINNLKLRRAPRYRLSELGTLRAGETVTVLGRTGRADWVQVESRLGVGWLDLRYVSFDGQTLALPVTENTVQPFAIITNSIGVIVRAGPSDDFPSIGTFQLNTELDIIGLHTANTYVQVRTNKGIGWVKLNAVRVEGSISKLRDTDRDVPPYAKVNVFRVNVRVAPNENAAEILTAQFGDLFVLEGRSANKAWLRIRVESGSAWVIASAIQLIGYDNLTIVS